MNDLANCGNCFLYHERKQTCPIDGKRRTKSNGCYLNYQPKDEHVQANRTTDRNIHS